MPRYFDPDGRLITAAAKPVAEYAGFKVGTSTVDVVACHGPDWFPLCVDSRSRSCFTLYMRRADLRRLRDRLDAIDKAFPEPEAKS